MDFMKIMKISLIEIGSVDYAQQLTQHADAILERLGLSPAETKVAKELVNVRKKALEDYQLINKSYCFAGSDEVVIENNEYGYEKLVKEKDEIVWHKQFLGITDDPTQKWSGKVAITEREIFELYKAEYIYEKLLEKIPRDFKYYYERCYGLAGMFKVFVNSTKAMK